jgi:hypothetical protein
MLAGEPTMKNPSSALAQLAAGERRKARLLSAWCFLVVTTVRLLEPIRRASRLGVQRWFVWPAFVLVAGARRCSGGCHGPIGGS